MEDSFPATNTELLCNERGFSISIYISSHLGSDLSIVHDERLPNSQRQRHSRSFSSEGHCMYTNRTASVDHHHATLYRASPARAKVAQIRSVYSIVQNSGKLRNGLCECFQRRRHHSRRRVRSATTASRRSRARSPVLWSGTRGAPLALDGKSPSELYLVGLISH